MQNVNVFFWRVLNKRRGRCTLNIALKHIGDGFLQKDTCYSWCMYMKIGRKHAEENKGETGSEEKMEKYLKKKSEKI